jgi:hypothetical protein
MSAKNINTLLDLWAATLLKHHDSPPFTNHSDLYETIDSTPLGGVPWQSFSLTYNGKLPDGEVPEWMHSEYDVWYHDPHLLVKEMLANLDFEDHIDYAPVQEFDSNGNRQYQNFMSGDWASAQAVCIQVVPLFFINFCLVYFVKNIIAQDPETHHAMFVPVMFGSNKTTVSVATGHNEYYPLYESIGNVHNNVRRAHHNAVVLIGFLAIPKSSLFSHIYFSTSSTRCSQ